MPPGAAADIPAADTLPEGLGAGGSETVEFVVPLGVAMVATPPPLDDDEGAGEGEGEEADAGGPTLLARDAAPVDRAEAGTAAAAAAAAEAAADAWPPRPPLCDAAAAAEAAAAAAAAAAISSAVSSRSTESSLKRMSRTASPVMEGPGGAEASGPSPVAAAALGGSRSRASICHRGEGRGKRVGPQVARIPARTRPTHLASRERARAGVEARADGPE